MKKFYNREFQLTELRRISNSIEKTKGKLSVMVGRRRVGKTRLLKEAFKKIDHPHLYLFISRKHEIDLVDEFKSILELEFDTKFFQPTKLLDIFEFIFHQSETQPLTLVVDEFQDIDRLDPSIFSGLQNLWDSYKNTAQIHWVCCGSLYSLMTRIFKGDRQPLLNRDDYFFKIQPLGPQYILQTLEEHQLFTPERMLQWWCLSGGVPKYLEWLIHAGETPFETLISSSSPLMEEGLHRLVEDFGSEHRAYFSVLAVIVNGHNSRGQIENYLNIGVGPLLEKLENEFDMIEKKRSIHAKENARHLRYQLVDPFLIFWFRFIHSHRSAVEMENFNYIKAVIARDFDTFSGWQLESLFTALLKESQQFNQIGSYWDSKGEHEIDIVAINDLEKRILVAEVKRHAKRFNPDKLAYKTEHLLKMLKLKSKVDEYQIEQHCFSLDNLKEVFEAFPSPF